MTVHRTKNIVHRKKSIEKIIEKLLKNRGIKTRRDREEFFNPKDPREISVRELGISDSGLNRAIRRIQRAIKDKEKIVVYGDYDVDGICAAAILWETLDSLGANALPYIPSRFTEGYGLSETGIKNLKLKIENCSLIITVDNGIVAYEGVDFANKNGIDVIITDHHESEKKLPDAHAIVHTTKVSGSAVAWVLARELVYQRASVLGPKDHLALASLGTISDILPLLGFNRSIATWGLRELRNTNRIGIKALCEEAQVKQEEIDTFHIGFLLGPRINAAGRVEHAMDSLRLLCARNPKKARELAQKLGKTNKLRQDKTEAVVNHVQGMHGGGWVDGNLPKLLFVHREGYDEGVIGIAAGRLVDQYHRPAIVVSRGEKFSKASARSVLGVDILEIIKKSGGDFFESIGGHPMAAGFTIPTEKLEALGQKLLEVSELEIDDKVLVRQTRVDLEIDFGDISMDLYLELAKFAPFGFGNPEPVFETKNVEVLDVKTVGKENSHLKLVLTQHPNTPTHQYPFNAIAFRMGDMLAKLKSNQPIEVIYSLGVNEWNNKRSIQLKVKNIRIPEVSA